MHPALAAQWSAGAGSPSAINDLLDDFGTLLDTEWRLLLTLGTVLVAHPHPRSPAVAAAVAVAVAVAVGSSGADPAQVSMMYGVMSIIVIWSSRGPVHWCFRSSLGL